MDYFLFDFSGVQFHYTMSQKILCLILLYSEVVKEKDDG